MPEIDRKRMPRNARGQAMTTGDKIAGWYRQIGAGEQEPEHNTFTWFARVNETLYDGLADLKARIENGFEEMMGVPVRAMTRTQFLAIMHECTRVVQNIADAERLTPMEAAKRMEEAYLVV